MTGATGELTPESSQDAFVPAERREASSADHQADVTATFNREGARLVEEGADAVGEPDPADDAAGRSEAPRGLPSHDPAFRMERHPSASETEEAGGDRQRPDAEGDPRLGGDVQRDPKEEHF